MSLEYIQKAYGVPAKKGQKIIYTYPKNDPQEGVIIGSSNAYLRIKFNDEETNKKHSGNNFHPTWEIKYID